MKRILALLVGLTLLLAACAAPAEEISPDDYTLYYAVRLDGADGGDAIRTCGIRIGDSASLPRAELAKRLVTALLMQPEDAELYAPFPSGTELQKITVAGGRATVDLSGQYARLSGVDLSLADYCMTLTLTQLDGIYAVRITANGRELPYRQTQLLTAADPLLSSSEDVIRPINVSLYFLDAETGELRAQQQTLALYEGQSRVSAVIEALARGPEGDDTLRVLLTADFSALSSRIEEKICYISLNPQVPLTADAALEQLALESIGRSLLSLGGVDEVQFLLDGEPMAQFPVEVSAPVADEPTET